MKALSMLTIIFLLLYGSINAQDSNNKNTTKNSIRKNSIYFELFGVGIIYSINYDRILQISKKTGIILRGGINYIPAFNIKPHPIGEIDVFMGSPMNFLEFGFGTTFYHPELDFPVMVRIGYRYQGPKGMLFRIAYFYTPGEYPCFDDIDLWGGLSIGYSF